MFVVRRLHRSAGLLRHCSGSAPGALRPPRSPYLQRSSGSAQTPAPNAASGNPTVATPPASPNPSGVGSSFSQASVDAARRPENVDLRQVNVITDSSSTAMPRTRFGPENVSLQPRDRLRVLLPTWNPPPTRLATPEDIKVGTKLRLLFEERWWPATVKEEGEGEAKIGYDSYPARWDVWVKHDAGMLYLHESHHPDYVPPPLPPRYERPELPEGPVAPRTPKVKPFDPEKERLKRALRPPMPYNPEKEALKRQLREEEKRRMQEKLREQDRLVIPEPQSQSAESERPGLREMAEDYLGSSGTGRSEAPSQTQMAQSQEQAQPQPQLQAQSQPGVPLQASMPSHAKSQEQAQDQPYLPGESSAEPWAQPHAQAQAQPQAQAQNRTLAPPPPPPPPRPKVEWTEVRTPQGQRQYRNVITKMTQSMPPTSGWVELISDSGVRYYWDVVKNVTQWERP